jgi:hypothetical protein
VVERDLSARQPDLLLEDAAGCVVGVLGVLEVVVG